jgi:prepilin-type N-terminal cleavage/methylation domain-containing protein
MERLERRAGFTLTELLVYMAILCIAVAMFARFMTGFMRTAKTSEARMLGSAELRRALAGAENDLYEANEFLWVSRSSAVFVCDMLKNPGWDPDGDQDGDGVPNIKDADADGDAPLKFSLPRDQQRQAGYNLEDDDDDNDGRTDVRIRLYYVPAARTVWRGISVNEGPWTDKTLAVDVSSFSLVYYGSKREDLGKGVDLGNDGAAGTGDAGESDGVIGEREMDWVQPPAGHGDRSGAVDTDDERRYVTSVAVYLETDQNKDGKVDAVLGTEVMPPLLPLKRRR